VGLRRAGFQREEVQALKAAFKLLYRSGLKRQDAVERILLEAPSDHTRHLAEFISQSKRGICGPSRRAAAISSGE
jgi:UDP-N-acetylglucosamine acyltransferase